MPVEDWIDRWTEVQMREIATLSESQRDFARQLSESQQRIEDRHESRMTRIEESFTAANKSNSDELSKLYDKLDAVYDKLDEFIKLSNEKAEERDKQHTINITELKTKFAYVSAGVGVVGGAFITWLFAER